MADRANLVRQLIPRSFHFDGYDLMDCRTSRDKPFFCDSVIHMNEYTLTIRRVSFEKISLEFESVCRNGIIYFKPYYLTIDEFVTKLKNAVKTGSDYIYFEIIPVYETRNVCIHCLSKTIDCKRMIEECPSTVLAAVSFDVHDIKRALAGYYEIVNSKGGNKMGRKNNFMGTNFEFGPSKDSNLAATLLGVAVRESYNGPWYTYDPVKHTRKNLANIKMGDFPIYLLPVAQMQPGDLIKRNGKYFWIKNVTEEGTFKAVGAADGQVYEILSDESLIPGFNLYTKVMALDMKSLTDPNGNSVANNVLAAMLMMNWSKNDGKSEFSLDDISDDSFNGMGAMLPLILANSSGSNIGNIFGGEGGQINLPMLMMLGGGDSDEGGFMQMYVLSQLLNNGGSTGLEGIIPGLSGNQVVKKSEGATVVCEKCGETYPEGTNFCPKCGGKTCKAVDTCSKCGAELMLGAAFCHKCGAKVGHAVCPNCGKEVPEEAVFCPSCGKNLNEQPIEVTKEDTVTTTT